MSPRRNFAAQTALLAGVVLALAGCASDGASSPAPQNPQPPAHPAAQPAAPEERVIVDNSLNGRIRVLKVIPSTRSNGLLEIQVVVKNIVTASQWLSYRVEWYDEDGKLVPSASGGVIPWLLLPGETASFFATAPGASAKDFEVALLAAQRQGNSKNP
jgi:uncharacterized protein YcfL